MKTISLKTLTILVVVVGGLSWLGSANGITDFLGGLNGKPWTTFVVAALGSILIQSLMAVFLNLCMATHVIHLRSRLLYLAGFAAMLALSSVLAISFWVSQGKLPDDRSAAVLQSNKDALVTVLKDAATSLENLTNGINTLASKANANVRAEKPTGQGDRHDFWVDYKESFESLVQKLKSAIGTIETEIANVDKSGHMSASIANLVGTINPTIKLIKTQISKIRNDEGKLVQSRGHRDRWADFQPELGHLENVLNRYEPPTAPTMENDPYEGTHGSKVYALNLVKKIVTGRLLEVDELFAVFLAVLTDLVFITLIVLRQEQNRPDTTAELEELYGKDVEALKSRLVRSGLAGGIGAVVGTLQTHGTGLFGLDRVFGLVVRVPDSASNSTLARVVKFLKFDATAYDVSGFAKLTEILDFGKTPAKTNGKDHTPARPVTILIMAARWRLLNRLKIVEDALPLPESNGTLADFVTKQRRLRPRVFSQSLVETLNRYFGSAMETNIDDLIPARIDRIIDTYRTDRRVKRLKRATREKHEAAFNDAINALRNEGLLPNGHLRVAV